MTAYELSDQLIECIIDGSTDLVCVEQAAHMLRQQADRITHLEMLVANRNEIIDKLNLAPQTKPLSDDEILDIFDYIIDENGYPTDVINLARAIEEGHGIK